MAFVGLQSDVNLPPRFGKECIPLPRDNLMDVAAGIFLIFLRTGMFLPTTAYPTAYF